MNIHSYHAPTRQASAIARPRLARQPSGARQSQTYISNARAGVRVRASAKKTVFRDRLLNMSLWCQAERERLKTELAQFESGAMSVGVPKNGEARTTGSVTHILYLRRTIEQLSRVIAAIRAARNGNGPNEKGGRSRPFAFDRFRRVLFGGEQRYPAGPSFRHSA